MKRANKRRIVETLSQPVRDLEERIGDGNLKKKGTSQKKEQKKNPRSTKTGDGTDFLVKNNHLYWGTCLAEETSEGLGALKMAKLSEKRKGILGDPPRRYFKKKKPWQLRERRPLSEYSPLKDIFKFQGRVVR